MEFIRMRLTGRKVHSARREVIVCVLAFLFFFGTFGCSDNVRLPSTEELDEFWNASPPGLSVDTSKIVKARIPTGPYRVMPDEVLQFTMPAILQVVTAEEAKVPDAMEPYLCRVSKRGTITLPVIGEMPVAGLSLAEIEDAVINAYYPRYTKVRPSVFARVQEFKTFKVSISGAVKSSGVYELRWDQMTLVNLLMAAGGIADQGLDRGAALIRIQRDPSARRVKAPEFKAYSKRTLHQNSPLSLASLAQWTDEGDKEEDLQLAFRSNSNSSTGRLYIRRNGVILVNQMVNLANSSDRQVVLNRVMVRDSDANVAELNQRLIELARILSPPSSTMSSVRLVSTGGRNGIDEDVASPRSAADDPIANPFVANHGNGFAETIVLPVKGLNIPFADVELYEGDSVVVERLVMPIFTVLGLVNKPGNYEYPPDVKYNLIQALGFAGGLDLMVDPRYITLYRLKQDGSVARAPFKLKNHSRLTEDMAIPILPGDIIAVEHTPRTRTTQFINNVFRMSISTYIRPDQSFD